jgi:hypothetical protein
LTQPSAGVITQDVADEAGEHQGDLIAEGATAPESLRQKDRFGFCDTLESVLVLARTTEGDWAAI